MAEKTIRCGCTIHRDSEDRVGCPVIQVERLTALVLKQKRVIRSTQAAFDDYITALGAAGMIEFVDDGEEE